MPAQLTDGHFAVLNRLAPEDGEDFVRLRRQMIADLLAAPDVKGSDLSLLQDEIEQRRAVSLSPQQSLAAMLQLLEERVADLQRLSEQLSGIGVG